MDSINDIRKDFESAFDWIYSGETEFVLMKVEKEKMGYHFVLTWL